MTDKLKKRNVEKEEPKKKSTPTVPVEVKKVPGKSKSSKKLSLSTICTQVAVENPKLGYNGLCKKAEEIFKEKGNYSFIIQNAMNDALDSLAVDIPE